MKNLIIVGSGGFGREVAWLVERINHVTHIWNLLGFLDDNESVQELMINGYKVLGKIDKVINYSDAYFVCAIGAAKVREAIIHKMKRINPEIKFAILIDPTVEMSPLVSIGEGTIICAHTIITVNVSIREHVIINLDCTIGHDVVLQDHVTLYPSVNISGNVNIGKCSELGTGTQIIQGKNVGSYSIVGAGSVIVRDIPDKCTSVGIPAKAIKFFE